MTFPAFFLAATVDIPVPQGGKSVGFVFSDLAILCLVLLFLTGALFFWAFFIRGPKQQSSTRRIERESSSDEEGSSGRRRKRKKVRRREHRKRNPTLAETGGLPEPRPPGTVPPI